MDLIGQEQDRHRPWEPRTIGASTSAALLVDLAHNEQLNARKKRNVADGRKTRISDVERRTVEALVLDVLSHHQSAESEVPISIHLASDWLSGNRKRPAAVNTGVRQRLGDLAATGWLFVTKGHNRGAGRLTTLRPGPRLIWATEQFGIELKDIGREEEALDEIVLKGSKQPSVTSRYTGPRRREQLLETEETQCLQQEVERLNRLFASAQISQRSPSAGLAPIDLSRRVVQRTFLDGRLDRGGRLGGAAFWLNLKKDRRRKALLIDGEPIAEIDLVAALPAIAYGIEGRTMWDDPYCPDELIDVPRDPLKTAFVVFLWDRYKPKTGRFPQEVYRDLPKGLTYDQVYQGLCRHNPPIAHFLGADEPRGAELMWHESEIIIDATFRCYKQEFSALPIHDALVVPASRADEATKALSDAFIARFKVSPMITHQVFTQEVGDAKQAS